MRGVGDQTADPRSLPGLSSAEAEARFRRDGPNEIPSAKHRPILALLLDAVREPMILLLLASGAIYLAIGDPRDAVILLASVFLVIGITLYQNHRTERALEALRDLSSPRARVIRDGAPRRVAGREVVRGDLLVVSEGDRVAADGELLWQSNVRVDESLLTGESVPVSKRARRTDEDAADAESRVFSGTLVVSGQGLARVAQTGASTELGRIGGSLSSIVAEKTPLQAEIGRLVRRLAVAGLAICAVIVLLYGRSRGSFLEGLLAGLAVVMSILPEEFPVVLTVFLALGAWRISRQNVLTRRIPAIEALGAATVLCVDKTGTLTLNRMAVAHLVAAGESRDVSTATELPESLHELVEFAVLASQRTPFDPMELAIRDFGLRTLERTEHLHEDWELLKEYPLSPELLAVSHAWKARGREDFVVAAKGAPEAIADLCHLDAGSLRRLAGQVEALAAEGLRVLGVAKARFHPATLPSHPHEFEFELLGLVGLEDPLRPSARAAVEECRTAGVRVVMLTGDYPVTAARIAREIGLGEQPPITGAELDRMDDAELARRVASASVFARVVPAQKLRLVQALKAGDEIVAMTGDGVNDAPALKAAHIGIAMGGRGTDVAREAAALVLLDDDFASIVQAIRLGRRIFDNLGKAMVYLLAVHVPIAGMALVPVLAGWPLLLLPVHIVLLELVIDPASSIAFEAEPADEDVMRRPPRPARARLLPGQSMALAGFQGLGVLVLALAVYAFELARPAPLGASRAAAFTALLVGNLGLILANRSASRPMAGAISRRNPALWWIVAFAVAMLALVLAVPGIRDAFHFSGVRPVDAALGIAAGGASLLLSQLLRVASRRAAGRAVTPREGTRGVAGDPPGGRTPV